MNLPCRQLCRVSKMIVDWNVQIYSPGESYCSESQQLMSCGTYTSFSQHETNINAQTPDGFEDPLIPHGVIRGGDELLHDRVAA